MTGLPKPFAGDRVANAVLLPLIGVGQAAALGAAAYGTRDAFAALHGGSSPGMAVLALLAFAGAAAAACEVLSRSQGEALGQSYARDLRAALYAHVAGMSRRAVAARRLGGLSLRFVGDLSAARHWFGRGLPRIVSGAVVLPAAGAVLWHLSPHLALAAAGPMVLAMAGMAGLSLGLRGRHARLRARRAGIAVAIVERLALAPDLDLMSRTDRELALLDTQGADLARDARARATLAALLRAAPQVGAGIAAAAVLWVAPQAGVDPGTVAAALSVLAILTIPLRDMASVWDDYCAWDVARDRARALLELPSHRRAVLPRGHPVRLDVIGVPVGGHVVTVSVPAGGVLRIDGPPGSGKSDLAGMIAGLDRPRSGQILHDGQDGPLPRIAMLGDRPVLLKGSLRRALTLGLTPRPTAREIRRLARAFGLSALVNHGGLDRNQVGEAGRDLGAGEGLRVDLTRIALTRPDLIVIDSAHLAGDPEADRLISRLRRETGATLVIVRVCGIPFDAEVALPGPVPAAAQGA